MNARVVVFAMLALASPAWADGGPAIAWGAPVHGLRVGLSATAHADRLRGITLTLLLENRGDRPLRVPGRLRLPWSWRFEFEPQSGGPALIAHFAQPPEPPEPPPPIELAPGERFPLRFDCRNWLQRELRTIERPGDGFHEIRAASVPVGAEPDLEAWTGEVHSGAVQVEIAFRDPLLEPEFSETPETSAAQPAPAPDAAPAPAPVADE